MTTWAIGWIFLCVAAGSSAACAMGLGTQRPAATARAEGTPARPLKELAGEHRVLIGSMLRAQYLGPQGDQVYQDFAVSQFSIITAPCYFAWVRPTADPYSFEVCDAVVRFGVEHKIAVRGHNLLWWNSVPEWVRPLTTGQLWDVLRQHVDTMVRRYKGSVAYWDVANELVDPTRASINGNVPIRDTTFWLSRLGPTVIDSVFIWAHRADPDARLFYNEYNIEAGKSWEDAIVRMATSLKQRKIPLDGIGLQFHLRLSKPIPSLSLERAFRRLAALGLEIHITELDVLVGHASPTVTELESQALYYQRVLTLCLGVPQCTAVVTWGFTDGHQQKRPRVPWVDAPFLLDSGYRAKPALDSVRSLLSQSSVQ